MKKTYFIWLFIYILVTVFAVIELPFVSEVERLTGICLFLIILFIHPLFKEKQIVQIVLFSIQLLLTIVIFYPVDSELNSFIFFIHALILAEAVFNLTRIHSLIVIVVQVASISWIILASNLSSLQIAWCGVFNLLVVLGLFQYQTIHRRENEIVQKNSALLDEYRRMKRQLVIEEEQARQDERNMIGHEIHDSVGHKLTALLMQLEVFRLGADEKDKQKILKLKELAEHSLDETRRAVKSFKQKDVGGLQGVMRLIRKLEMESFMKIHFSVKHGAFAAPLTGEQSFAIYRSVQEALTNIMKHSSTREAQVSFESPGGSIFRFEVINKSTFNPFFQEGYGLKAMRERLEKVGGSCEIIHDEQQFIVRGTIALIERGG
ncbi:sensor histidine kinase [Bacillus nitroreducens]